MSKHTVKRNYEINRIYRNEGVLEDAYTFNLIDEAEDFSQNTIKAISIFVSRSIYRILMFLIFINYLFMYSLVWLIKKSFSQIVSVINHLVVYLVKVRLRENH